MSNLGTGARSRTQTVPTPPTGRKIASYDTYLAAQRAVDFLSDKHFPVQFVTIVGTDLQMVERVTGRLTYGRVAMAGAASGAWFGLFVGLLLSLFARGTTLVGTVLPALVIGAGFGILFGVLSYALTGGKRDFTSTSQVVASQYAILCAPEHAGAAEQLLAQLPDDGTQRVSPRTTSAPPPSAPPPSAPPPSQPSVPGAPPEAEQPPAPTGPTYGEMIEKQRRVRLARERGELPPEDDDQSPR
jgi:hypothetical protein